MVDITKCQHIRTSHYIFRNQREKLDFASGGSLEFLGGQDPQSQVTDVNSTEGKTSIIPRGFWPHPSRAIFILRSTGQLPENTGSLSAFGFKY